MSNQRIHKVFLRRLTTVTLCLTLSGAMAQASDPTAVPSANPKAPGKVAPNILSVELRETAVAQGSMPLENPSALAPFYGYNSDGPMMPAPGDLPSATHKVEASKTEPDKNTYLFLPPQKGADIHYNYGTHYLFQGHETGQIGYITRVNLDASVPARPGQPVYSHCDLLLSFSAAPV